MHKVTFRSLFQAWCSAQSVCLFLFIVYILVLAVKTLQLGSSEVASWVQAIGAIVSIWAAWWISRQQSVRAVAESKRGDLAKSLAVAGMLEHILRLVQHEPRKNQGTISGREVCAAYANALSMLDRVDLLLLPHPALVQAVFLTRHAVEKLDLNIKLYLEPNKDAIIVNYYEFGLSVECVGEIKRQIEVCGVVAESYLS
ncbi:hypothetical protein [Pseudomonas sp. 13B_3.2_Bac1]|uniref:hypothetical protein n=1 Tax=Pseudomonas sp. 13B_3.2_Bac1 TaxID=2971623 RepID=UPI0021CAB540|nr:hypothetical protein [Pseudomonas sp. 13B_3.2_Bac1]MCU1773255.1 hypothetical protein [Pseudomonas sp. 13B_3.2_Bac1]